MNSVSEFLQRLENVVIAFIASFSILFCIGALIPSIWAYVFSILVSFVLSDLILNAFIHGGEGHANIFSKNEFAHKGHAYVVFLIGIIISTVLSSLLADFMFQGYLQDTPWVATVFITDGIAVFLVLGDLKWRFYLPNKNR